MMPRMSVIFMSTVEILVIPPFFAADFIEASPPKQNTRKKTGALASPILLPTGLLVAATGIVIEQEERQTTMAAAADKIRNFIVKIWNGKRQSRPYITGPKLSKYITLYLTHRQKVE